MRNNKGQFVKGYKNEFGTQFKKGGHYNFTTEFKKGQEAWNTGKKIQTNTGRTHFTKERVNDPLFKKKRIDALPKGKNHYAWAGDEIEYGGLHDWIRKELGRPTKCEICGEHDEQKMYHWANKDHTYKRVVSDWMRLCVPCHKLYDNKSRRINYLVSPTK